jgi:hypothetical protein
MPGAGDRQEFGEAFDDAEYRRLEVERNIHARAILRDRPETGEQ